MRKSPFSRATNLLLAIWFALSVGGPVGEFACPTHNHGDAAVLDGGAGTAGDAVGGAAHDHHGAEPTDTPSHDSHGDCCTCPGDCAAGGSVPLQVDPGTDAGWIALRDSQVLPPTLDRPVVADEWLLPPSTAPPAPASA